MVSWGLDILQLVIGNLKLQHLYYQIIFVANQHMYYQMLISFAMAFVELEDTQVVRVLLWVETLTNIAVVMVQIAVVMGQHSFIFFVVSLLRLLKLFCCNLLLPFVRNNIIYHCIVLTSK